jgi:hypothetical protein
VAKELRRGYTWRGRVIRYAEVQAVRTSSQPAADHDGEATEPVETNGVDIEMDRADELETTDELETAEGSLDGPA